MPSLRYKDPTTGEWKVLVSETSEVEVNASGVAPTASGVELWIDESVDATVPEPTDHGLLSGLTDDDHPQYLTDARGDAKYLTQASADAAYLNKAGGTMSGNLSAPGVSVAGTSPFIDFPDAVRTIIPEGMTGDLGVWGVDGQPTPFYVGPVGHGQHAVNKMEFDRLTSSQPGSVVANASYQGEHIGALFLTLPVQVAAINQGMWHIEVKGYEYNGGTHSASAWTLLLDGYAYSSGWVAPSAHWVSSNHVDSAGPYPVFFRFFREAGTSYFGIQIGDIGQHWFYPTFTVEAYPGYAVPTASIGVPWTVEFPCPAISTSWDMGNVPVTPWTDGPLAIYKHICYGQGLPDLAGLFYVDIPPRPIDTDVTVAWAGQGGFTGGDQTIGLFPLVYPAYPYNTALNDWWKQQFNHGGHWQTFASEDTWNVPKNNASFAAALSSGPPAYWRLNFTCTVNSAGRNVWV